MTIASIGRIDASLASNNHSMGSNVRAVLGNVTFLKFNVLAEKHLCFGQSEISHDNSVYQQN